MIDNIDLKPDLPLLPVPAESRDVHKLHLMRLRRPLEAGFPQDDLIVDGPRHQFHRARVRLRRARQGGEVRAHVLLRSRGERDIEPLETMAQHPEQLVRREVLEDQGMVELVHPALGELLRHVLVRRIQLREHQGAFAARLHGQLLDLQADLLHAAAVVEAGVRELRVVRVDEDQAVAGLAHRLAQDALEERFGDIEEPLGLDLRDMAVGNQAHALEDGRHDLRDRALAGTAAADEPPRQQPLAHIRLADVVQVAGRLDEMVDSLLDIADARERIEPGEGFVDGIVIEHDGLAGLADDHVLREDGAEVFLRRMLDGRRPRSEGGEDVVPDEVRHEPAVAEPRGRAFGPFLDDGPHIGLRPRREDKSLLGNHLLADFQKLVRGVVLEAEHVREAAFDALVALQELLHGRGIARQDDDHVRVLPAEFRQERVHDDAAVVVVAALDQLVGLVDEKDVAAGARQQPVHLLLGLADVLAHHPGLLRADDPASGQDAPGGEHPADDLRDGGFSRAGVAEEGHVEAGRVRGQAQLHAPGGKADGVQVVLDPRLDLAQADQGVQLAESRIGSIGRRGDVRIDHLPEIVQGQVCRCADAPVHRGNHLLVEEAADHPGVVEARSAVVIQAGDIRLQLPARVLRQGEAAAFAASVDFRAELLQAEVPEPDGRGDEVPKFGEGSEERVHPVGLAAQDQHPAGIFLLVRERVDEGVDHIPLRLVRLAGRPAQLAGVQENERPAAGVGDQGERVVIGFGPDGRRQGRETGRHDVLALQVAEVLVHSLEEVDARLHVRSGIADERRVQDGRVGREARLLAGVRDAAARDDVLRPLAEAFERRAAFQGREALLDGRGLLPLRRFLRRGPGGAPHAHGTGQEEFIVL